MNNSKVSHSEQKDKIISCVTGGTGMVGRRIVNLLQKTGYSVRVFTRKKDYDEKNVEVINGSLEDEENLNIFLSNAGLLFHCAGETRDESKMWEVNVVGTERLMKQVVKSKIIYFCYISSAGVIGKTEGLWVNESTPCNPQNTYERSKLASERLLSRGINGCRVAILRPTNVIDNDTPGFLSLPMRASWRDRLHVFIKGGECAHLIHSIDVAAAAVSLIDHPVDEPQCFFVSYDDDPLNTFADLWSLYRAIKNERPIYNVQPVLHMPLFVPYIIRRLRRGFSNRGDIRYSSGKLLSTGFHYHLGVEGAVRHIAAAQHIGAR